eukprot:CAMPEP_0177184732 /NCGR_PEP_ID=MMETSP0367-20130122/17716_1 /TAXON_ID=447022 ORGANISM="Scrippsiella hangoei-like, Strain SHHI-4" /NCGR_SAMPLE_ID=MMETSP0367 /ASSEMBLY_ACC=CAM_ASM_000362 /LENGTH=47 /DNA_ID= /DNA_START= /DNA_END= /DNA_ORIENTATION=
MTNELRLRSSLAMSYGVDWVRQLGLSDSRKAADFLAHHGQAGGDGLA